MFKSIFTIIFLCALNCLVAMETRSSKKVVLMPGDFRGMVLRPDQKVRLERSPFEGQRPIMCRSASLPTNLSIIYEESSSLGSEHDKKTSRENVVVGNEAFRQASKMVQDAVFESEVVTSREIAGAEIEHGRSVSAPTSPSLPSAVVATTVAYAAITPGRLQKKSASAQTTPCMQFVGGVKATVEASSQDLVRLREYASMNGAFGSKEEKLLFETFERIALISKQFEQDLGVLSFYKEECKKRKKVLPSYFSDEEVFETQKKNLSELKLSVLGALNVAKIDEVSERLNGVESYFGALHIRIRLCQKTLAEKTWKDKFLSCLPRKYLDDVERFQD